MCALHIHVVFEGHWHACKRAKLIEITGGKRVIDELRGSKRRFWGEFAATSSSVIPMRVYVAISRTSFSVTCSAIAILILASVSLPQRAKHALTGHLLTVIHHNKSCRAT